MSAGRLLLPLAMLGLAACGANDGDPGPGGVTAGEAKALDEAAEMLEERGRTPADDSAAELERVRAEAARAANAD
ncbi:MAG: hypothetical protein GW859_06785 [Sphingomonadales bacterium]|nr:hypothetical protein [Sphingomonadales bacterium]